MRHYIPSYGDINISRNRYRELLAFCRQYPEWKAELSSLVGIKAQQYETAPQQKGLVNDPVYNIVTKRETLKHKIDIIENAAGAVEDGAWKAALIQNVCMNKALKCIDPVILPTSHNNSFYKAKKMFFYILDDLKEKQE